MKTLFLFMVFNLFGTPNVAQAFSPSKNLPQMASNIEIVTFEMKTSKIENPPSTCWDTIGNPCQDSPPSPPITRKNYIFKVKNTGAKTVQTIWWRYVDAWATGESYRDYLSTGKIKPGQTKKLAETEYREKSTGLINATYTDAERAKHQGKHIVIMCVQYTDGTIWKRS